MVQETVTCCHCGSTDVTRYGIAPNGKQKYFCRTCQRQSRANPAPNGYPEERKEEILRAYEERSSLRGLERTFGVSRMTVIAWLKKKAAHLIHLETTLREPENPTDVTLELDELWSFVGCKGRKRWVWLALCRETRHVVAFVIGDRSAATCQRLWDAIPSAYRQGMCYSDFWEAYHMIIPDDQHEAVGKETGETAHSERFNNTIRQRLARFVRKTLSFSKTDLMHEVCLRLFLFRYNCSLRA